MLNVKILSSYSAYTILSLAGVLAEDFLCVQKPDEAQYIPAWLERHATADQQVRPQSCFLPE